MSDLTDEEHKYFHQLMFILTGETEPKFTSGAVEHRSKGDLWNMSDEELDKNFNEELLDMMVFFAEKLRRKHERHNL